MTKIWPTNDNKFHHWIRTYPEFLELREKVIADRNLKRLESKKGPVFNYPCCGSLDRKFKIEAFDILLKNKDLQKKIKEEGDIEYVAILDGDFKLAQIIL